MTTTPGIAKRCDYLAEDFLPVPCTVPTIIQQTDR